MYCIASGCVLPPLTEQEHLRISLNELSSQTDRIRSLTYFPHIRVACETATYYK